jgi:ABC-2 type transport system ATP-binding protein
MNKLSGGMKRRFMVAKALIHQPKLLILDEPTAGVDVELRQQLWEFVRELNEKRGITVLLTTHYLEEAEEMCGRIAIMNHGDVIAMNKTHALLDQLDEKRLVVHLEKNISEMPKSLAAFEGALEEAGMAISLKIKKGDSVTDALTLITNLGLQIRDIETRAPNLQEAFLKLTAGTYGVRHHA